MMLPEAAFFFLFSSAASRAAIYKFSRGRLVKSFVLADYYWVYSNFLCWKYGYDCKDGFKGYYFEADLELGVWNCDDYSGSIC